MEDFYKPERPQPVGFRPVQTSNYQLNEPRSSLVIEGQEQEDEHPPKPPKPKSDDGIMKLYYSTKIEMLQIIEADLNLKLELRAIKEEFLELLKLYCSESHSGDEENVLRREMSESDHLDSASEAPVLDDSGLHDSSTVVCSTDAYYFDSSTVEETPTNRKMPRDQFLQLNEDGSRACNDNFTPPAWARGSRCLASGMCRDSRRSLLASYSFPKGDNSKETDEESGCYSRAPTYPGSDTAGESQKTEWSPQTSNECSPDYSMECNKDSYINLGEVTTPSTEGVRSSDVTINSSMYDQVPDQDESSYKESDAAWSPEGNNFVTPRVLKMEDEKSFELSSQRKVNNRKLLMERMTRQVSATTCSSQGSDARMPRQVSAATCSSLGSEVRLPYAPVNSPNSTAITNDFDLTTSSSCLQPRNSTRNDVSVSCVDYMVDLPRIMFQDLRDTSPIRHEEVNDRPAPYPAKLSTIDVPLPDISPDDIHSHIYEIIPDLKTTSSIYEDIPHFKTSSNSMNTASRPPCIGKEANTDALPLPKPGSSGLKIFKPPSGKNPFAIRRSSSFNLKRSSKSSLISSSSGASASSEPAPQAHQSASSHHSLPDTKRLQDSDVIDIDPYIEKAQKSNRLSKKFPLLKRIQSFKNRFKTGSKGKAYIQKDLTD